MGHRVFRVLAMAGGALLGAGLLAACSTGSTGTAGGARPAASGSPAAHYRGTLNLEPASGPVGTQVTVTGGGFPANQAVDVTWQQVTGSWQVANGQFSGSDYKEKYVAVASATTDAAGAVKASFKVPEGFGQKHNVRITHAGTDWNQASYKIPLAASITPSSGPPGTRIGLTLTGIGFKVYFQNYIVTYDNLMTGWLSAVTTSGTAHATIPATGAPGAHYIAFYAAGDRVPYLNNQQSPVAGPTYVLPFTVTAQAPVLPASAEAQTPAAVDAVQPAAAAAGPQVWLNRASGPPGTPLTLRGSGFPAGQQVKIGWDTLAGNNVGSGVGEVTKPLATALASPTGSLELAFNVPVDLFGDHRVSAVAGSRTATTSFSINPRALPLQPASGPVGSDVTIHVLGTGSTFTGNIYAITYDNAYIGFACGFNSQGDITVHIPATGAPGIHYIDLYPSVWKVSKVEIGNADYIQMPQLTYRDDHPVEKLPAFEYAFTVTA